MYATRVKPTHDPVGAAAANAPAERGLPVDGPLSSSFSLMPPGLTPATRVTSAATDENGAPSETLSVDQLRRDHGALVESLFEAATRNHIKQAAKPH